MFHKNLQVESFFGMQIARFFWHFFKRKQKNNLRIEEKPSPTQRQRNQEWLSVTINSAWSDEWWMSCTVEGSQGTEFTERSENVSWSKGENRTLMLASSTCIPSYTFAIQYITYICYDIRSNRSMHLKSHNSCYCSAIQYSMVY